MITRKTDQPQVFFFFFVFSLFLFTLFCLWLQCHLFLTHLLLQLPPHFLLVNTSPRYSFAPAPHHLFSPAAAAPPPLQPLRLSFFFCRHFNSLIFSPSSPCFHAVPLGVSLPPAWLSCRCCVSVICILQLNNCVVLCLRLITMLPYRRQLSLPFGHATFRYDNCLYMWLMTSCRGSCCCVDVYSFFCFAPLWLVHADAYL